MKVLLATDGSECSRFAVEEVAKRPWPAGSTIEVAMVVDVAYRGAPQFGPISPEYFDSLERALETTADAALHSAEDALAPIRAAGHEVVTKRLVGPPAMAILDEAEREHADLVVVGSHGRGTIGRMLLGSVSHAVVAHAPCSVEVVRRHE